MSWFTEISEKAENLLNTLDKTAAKTLNKQKNIKNGSNDNSLHITEPDNSIKISLEDDIIPIPKQNDVFLSLSDDSPSSKVTENPEQTISYQRSASPNISNSINEQFQTEMLQNEIHSLNNEISLLLNRAKIAEQKSINLSEKLTSVEYENKLLEEQLANFTTNGLPESDTVLKSTPSNTLPNVKLTKTDKSEWHEHYETQIQELLQDKTNLEETLKSKNDEIMMLKSRLNQKSYSFSNDDLSSRLRALTITLVQKQSALERLTSDNNSLEAEYDQLQRKYEEVVNRLHQRISINDTDDVKAQIPLFKSEKCYGSGLRHRIRNAYSSLPPSLNVEVLFKKSALVRAFVWIYLILMHGLVFLLLNSHMPESANV